MKVLFILIAISIAIGCASNELRFPAGLDDEQKKYYINSKKLKSLYEETLVWRVNRVAEYKALKPLLEADKPLSQWLQNKIVGETLYYLELRERTYGLVEKFKPYILKTTDFSYTIDIPSYKGTVDGKLIVRINPQDELGQVLIKEMKLSLSAALMLFDNFIIGVAPYAHIKEIRSKINQDRKSTYHSIEEIEDAYLDWGNRQKMQKALHLFEEEQAWVNSRKGQKWLKTDIGIKSQSDEDIRYLNTLIKSSPSYKDLRKISLWEQLKNKVKKGHTHRKSWYKKIGNNTMNSISKGFGNTVGLVEFRKGKLYKKNRLTREIEANLQPLDILLEKTPFRLTDTFIPGHWGHAAIWMGTESELKSIKKNDESVWDALPRIYGPERAIEMQSQIKNGQHVLEALRPGVMLNTLDHFMNIDDIGVMRRSKSFQLSEELTFDYLILAFNQVGKEYDFNFDVSTDNKIVCSELIYKVYPDDNWPSGKALNRWTISPDNVAQLAIETVDNAYKYDVTLIYTAGKKVEGDSNQLRSKMAGLLANSYDDTALYIYPANYNFNRKVAGE